METWGLFHGKNPSEMFRNNMEKQNNVVVLMAQRSFQMSRLKEGQQINTLDFLLKWISIFRTRVAKGVDNFYQS